MSLDHNLKMNISLVMIFSQKMIYIKNFLNMMQNMMVFLYLVKVVLEKQGLCLSLDEKHRKMVGQRTKSLQILRDGIHLNWIKAKNIVSFLIMLRKVHILIQQFLIFLKENILILQLN